MEQLINRGIEALYNEYLEAGTPETMEEAKVSGLSAALDGMIEEHTVSHSAIGMYEEAARRAGFYAGVRAAMSLITGK